MTTTIKRTELLDLLRAGRDDLAAGAAERVRESVQPEYEIWRATATVLADTFDGKYSFARERGHVVTGLEEIVRSLRSLGQESIRGVLVDSSSEYFIVAVDFAAKSLIGVLHVIPKNTDAE